MKALQLPWEIHPYVVNQRWGVHNPKIYSQFGFTAHNGEDVRLGTRAEVRAPFPWVFHRELWQPQGGGRVLSILSRDEYKAPDGKAAYVLVDYMHLEKVLVSSGQSGETGHLLCIADNTGFSTGTHTHIQYRWVRKTKKGLVDVQKNKANNSFDPTPYRTGGYAVELLTLSLLQRVFHLLRLQRGLQ